MVAALPRKPGLIIAAIIAGVGGVLAAAVLFAWSGLYSVAASRGHWAVVSAFLDFGMRSSVRTHAALISVPPLDDSGLVHLGAAHFHGSCAICHGAPGIPRGPVAKQMLPPPPVLEDVADRWKPNELFWIVKHGIKYTGMPGWAAEGRDDEVWAVVAFLRELPHLGPERYRQLAVGRASVDALTGREVAISGSGPFARVACARCHGFGEAGPTSDRVPALHGQREEYLSAALQAYAKGNRNSGIMEPIAAALESETIGQLASYYSRLKATQPQFTAKPAPSGTIEKGRRLVSEGAPDKGIPPCASCHGATALPTYPRLNGQPAAYTAGQLRLWKREQRGETANAAIMAPIARRLTDEQIEDVAAYYADGGDE